MLSSRTKKNKHGCLHVVQKRLESAHAQSCQKHFICLVNNSGAQKHLAAKDAFTIQENLFITVLIFSTVKYVRGSMLDCHLGKYRWWCCWGEGWDKTNCLPWEVRLWIFPGTIHNSFSPSLFIY